MLFRSVGTRLFLRGYRFLPRAQAAQATTVAHNLTQPVSVSSSEHPWPGHDDVRDGPVLMAPVVQP